MKLVLFLFLLIPFESISQDYTYGNLATDLLDMCFWNYSRVELHLKIKKIPFEYTEFTNGNGFLIKSTDSEIAFGFQDKEPKQILYRFIKDKMGDLDKEVYYIYLNAICGENIYGEWLYKNGPANVFIRFNSEYNGFVISKD